MKERNPIRRLLDTFKQLLGMRVVPAVDFLALYAAKVVTQSSDFTKGDLQPDDPRIPGVSGVPITLGLPGCTVQVAQGARMLLGWRGGDPSQPYAQPSWENGASVTKLVLKATTVYLGDESGAEALVKKSEFDGHTHQVPGTGTACAAIGAPWTGSATAATPTPVTGTTNVRGK